MKKAIIFITMLCCAVLLLCGCDRTTNDPTQPSGIDSQAPSADGHETDIETPSEETVAEDDEIAAAIANGEPALFWRIGADAQLSGTVSSWSYQPMDCDALWSQIKAELLPDAAELSSEMIENGAVKRIELQNGEDTLRVNVGTASIQLIGLEPDAAEVLVGQLAALLTERSGFTLQQIPADTEEGENLCYAFFADGVKVDTAPYETTMGSALRIRDGDILLDYPIALGERLETSDLSATFSMQEAKLLCELQWEANFVPLVCTLDSYQPLYIIDATNGRLIPGWQFLGRFWDMTGYNHGMDYVINALTGEVIRFG